MQVEPYLFVTLKSIYAVKYTNVCMNIIDYTCITLISRGILCSACVRILGWLIKILENKFRPENLFGS